MTDKELVKKYIDTFSYLDFEPGEILSVEDMVSSLIFTKEEAKMVFNFLSSPSSDFCSY